MSEPAAINDLIIGDTVSLLLYGNGAITSITDGVLLGKSDGAALRDPVNAAANHANIYPAIPTPHEVADNPTSYEYLLIRRTDESLVEIGVPWIQPPSVQRNLRYTATIVLDDFDPAMKSAVTEILQQNGLSINAFTVV